MPRVHLYADESGNFDFSRRLQASRYFILTTVTLDDHAICGDLLALRRELAWRDIDVERTFHATEDAQAIRDDVFAVLERHAFRVDATIIDKWRIEPAEMVADERLYHYAWHAHMTNLANEVVAPTGELLVIAASIGTKRKRAAFFSASREAMVTVSPTPHTHVAHWPAATDPALQLTDYCSWAIQRKWERRDLRSYRLIARKIATELRVEWGGR